MQRTPRPGIYADGAAHEEGEAGLIVRVDVVGVVDEPAAEQFGGTEVVGAPDFRAESHQSDGSRFPAPFRGQRPSLGIIPSKVGLGKDRKRVQECQVLPKPVQFHPAFVVGDIGDMEGPKRIEHVVAHVTERAACQVPEHRLQFACERRLLQTCGADSPSTRRPRPAVPPSRRAHRSVVPRRAVPTGRRDRSNPSASQVAKTRR